MGNTQSSKKINLLKLIDTIASKYILTQNFKDLQNLHNPEYCNKLTILTSNILASRFNVEEIEYLNQRTQKGNTVNELNTEDLLYIHKDDLRKLDIQTNLKKKRMCIGIAKFYIKIAHLFSAIVSTINPKYTYKDNSGNFVVADYSAKYNKAFKLSKVNLCSKRIQSTVISQIKDNSNNLTDDFNVKSNLCSINKTSLNLEDGNNVINTRTLIDEPGIPELKQLYYDVYNYDSGKFVGMSESSKKAYKYDLQQFYKAFTGNKELPNNINSFSDIQLRDFHNNPRCKGDNAIYNKSITGSISKKLYKNYANQLKIMTINANKNRNKLLNILNQIFVYRVDPETKNKEITLYPKLNYELLDKLVVESRNIIIKLYIDCENDYIKLIQLFEAVVENQVKKNTIRKINNLKRQKTEIIAEL